MASINQRRAMLVLLVLSGLIISTCMGLRQSLGLFLRPLTLGLGISAATFGFSIALQNIVWGLSQPFVGALADRYGPRPVLIGTALMYAAGLLLMVFANAVPGGLQIAGFLTGIGIAGTGFGVLIGTVSRAVPPQKRTQTVGMVAAVGSLGTMVIAPIAQGLITAFDWKVAMVVFAVLAAGIALLALPIREQSAAKRSSLEPSQSLSEVVRQAMGHRGFLYMTVAFFACGFQLVFITSYLPSYLQICGVAPGVGASALALIGLFNAIGTYIFGQLGARYSQKHLLALIYLLRTLTIVVFLLAPVSATSTLVFAAAMGLLWLGVVPLVTGIVGRVFGLTHFNTLYGIVFLSHQVGSFVGAWMGGVVFDRMGDYNFAWGALIFIGTAAFLLQWMMDERPPRQRTSGAQPAAVPA
ncbi:MAG TPA: MFS transporter [Burkholderiaceae bacterium]|jgi:predicted MFS family arabinose efflux permease|nr:MFS transporter [Burkholderiaceae bacterium]